MGLFNLAEARCIVGHSKRAMLLGDDMGAAGKTGLTRRLKAAIDIAVQVHRDKATEMIEFELKELENIFSLLILGGLAGMPSPPVPIAMELLPYMERELTIMLARTDLAQDPLGSLMGILEVD